MVPARLNWRIHRRGTRFGMFRRIRARWVPGREGERGLGRAMRSLKGSAANDHEQIVGIGSSLAMTNEMDRQNVAETACKARAD